MEYNVNELFGPVIDSTETVEKVLRPNKKRYIGFNILKGFFGFLFASLFGIIWIFICGLGDGEWTDEEGNVVSSPSYIGYIIIGIALLVFIISILVLCVRYNKTYYAITNKRIIIRDGFIGADFRQLDLAQVINCDVNVDLLDKFLHPNTGSILFGTAATPVMFARFTGNGSGGNSMHPYAFHHVDNPYEVCKQIKEAIDGAKH